MTIIPICFCKSVSVYEYRICQRRNICQLITPTECVDTYFGLIGKMGHYQAISTARATPKVLCNVLSVSADALLFDAPAGVDALLRGLDAERVDSIRELVQLQLKLLDK